MNLDVSDRRRPDLDPVPTVPPRGDRPPAVPRGSSDAALLAAHVRGDRGAFAELVRRHRAPLWREALGVLAHREDAEDAVQEALARAAKYAHTYRGDAPVGRWLTRIVVNVARSTARRRDRRDLAGPAAGPDRTPVDPMERVDDAAVVRAALRRLPDELRRTYFLAVVRGLSTDDVAALTGVPAGTVKSRLWRARGGLSAVLDEAFWAGTDAADGRRST